MKSDEFYRQTVGEKETKFSISSKIEEIDEAVQKATAFASDAGFGDDALFGIDMAVREALANAVKHGNKSDPNKLVRITAELTPQEASFTVEDEGEGFDITKIPDPCDPANLFRTSGRGVLLIYNIMDEVEYNAQGNRVKMVKRPDAPRLEATDENGKARTELVNRKN